MMNLKVRSLFVPLAAAASLLCSPGGASAQVAGVVEFARGVGVAQTQGQIPRTLGKGLPLREGDRLITTEGGSAIVKLEDGTRMSVRPNTEVVLQRYQFRQDADDNAMLMQLVRGGLRTITGLISKNAPEAARIQTSTATIGIRGTDFDARICARDCNAESAAISETSRPNAVLATAKVLSSQGVIDAVDSNGVHRRLVNGGSVYPGDTIQTAGGAFAVLAFRDESRLTLGSGARLRIDNFVFDPQNAAEGRFLASLLKGSLRAQTGLVAQANPQNMRLATGFASIGARAGGLDLLCTGGCAGEAATSSNGLSVFTWQGSSAVTRNGRAEEEVLQAGQGLFISSNSMRPIASAPAVEGPRPDAVAVPAKLFGSDNASDAQEGLFVLVRDGHIEIATQRDVIHLGRGEAGFAGANGNTSRPLIVPKFLEFDKIPLPTVKNPLLSSVLSQTIASLSDAQCR